MLPLHMGAVNDHNTQERLKPKSIRHKQVLDLARDRPDASMEEIAERVQSATPDLVEQVLDEYGDPASNKEDAPEERDIPGTSNSYPDFQALTDAQVTTLKTINERPEATQQEIGEALGVTASTVCHRLKAIDGFDWSNRQSIANTILESYNEDPDIIQSRETDTNDTHHDGLDQLRARITTLEHHLSDNSNTEAESNSISNPELIQKVMHACLSYDDISEDEEFEIIKVLL